MLNHKTQMKHKKFRGKTDRGFSRRRVEEKETEYDSILCMYMKLSKNIFKSLFVMSLGDVPMLER